MGIQTGDIVGDYRVMEAIGAGGMGAVYKVEHRITKRIEAMKAVSTGLGVSDEEVRRFEREIQAQARLQHPNIAAVYSAVRHGDVLALVMEYVEGESLRRVLERGRIEVATAIAIAAEVLAALDCAHRNGVAHGDVSPANILIARSGGAKLTDFGLALDGSGAPAGTAWYMAPEQVRAIDRIDARTDIYAAGAVLHEMLTGRKLFEAEGAFAIMRCHVEEIPRPPGAYRAKVPAALDGVVMRALAKEPAARFQTAAEFRDAVLGARAHSRRRTVLAVGVASAAAVCGFAVSRTKGTETVRVAPVMREIPAPPTPVVDPAPAPEPAPAVAVEASAPPKRAGTRKPPPKTSSVATTGTSSPAAAAPLQPAVSPEPAAENHPVDTVDVTTLPVTRSSNIAVPAIPAPQVEAPKQKTGNRFVKALGKINPFRKSSKNAPEDGK